ncbi:MAG: tRNA (N(6)-L-threonylcarbamoyladenosine(37)-C(2))-methylthiotransferase MtaB [Pseudomonadota bacterium]
MADAPHIINQGCRLNAYEGEAMRNLGRAAGVGDAVVVNTCAVTNESVRQARQTIRRARKERPDARIIVTGCAAQIDPAAFAAMPEVDAVLGNHEKMQDREWRALAETPAQTVRVNDIMSVRETANHLIDGMEGRARAFVQIQNGCDHRCTFCIIPYGRGNSRSAPMGEIIDQIRRLVKTGYKEVVLTGVDITSFGTDLPGTPTLGKLVRKILKLVPDLPRLRLSSIDSIEVDPDLYTAIADDPRVTPHLHLSLQSGDDMILKRMKRRHSRAQSIAFCQDIKARRPDIAFGADLIVGFPTETEEMFENTLRLVEECDLDYLHVFPFSPREGTPAARMPQVARPIVKARAARLRAVAKDRLARRLDRHVGREADILVERGGRGRLPDYAEATGAFTTPPGQIVRARLTGHNGAALAAAPLAQETF